MQQKSFSKIVHFSESVKTAVHTAVASGSKCAANGSSAVSAATEIIS